MNTSAIFSDCRLYRYVLWRDWSGGQVVTPRYLMVVGLNPSTADETRDDPTIRKCIGFAKKWGYDALCMTNLFSWRDTDPEAMKKVPRPVGPNSDKHLIGNAKDASMVLAAWGNHGSHLNRSRHVCALLAEHGIPLKCLKTNRDGSPGHPLYVPYSAEPKFFTHP